MQDAAGRTSLKPCFTYGTRCMSRTGRCFVAPPAHILLLVPLLLLLLCLVLLLLQLPGSCRGRCRRGATGAAAVLLQLGHLPEPRAEHPLVSGPGCFGPVAMVAAVALRRPALAVGILEELVGVVGTGRCDALEGAGLQWEDIAVVVRLFQIRAGLDLVALACS